MAAVLAAMVAMMTTTATAQIGRCACSIATSRRHGDWSGVSAFRRPAQASISAALSRSSMQFGGVGRTVRVWREVAVARIEALDELRKSLSFLVNRQLVATWRVWSRAPQSSLA